MGFRMYVPTKIVFGEGKLNTLSRQRLPGKKALLVISSGKSVRENGALARTQEQLKEAGIDWVLFDQIMANPLKSAVMAGADCARENGCDLVVALGGGSVMDAAKAIAAMAVNDGDLWDYVVGGTGKKCRYTPEILGRACQANRQNEAVYHWRRPIPPGTAGTGYTAWNTEHGHFCRKSDA